MLKVRRLGWKPSGFRTVRILKIYQTSGPDVMSGRALTQGMDTMPYKCTLFTKRKFYYSREQTGCPRQPFTWLEQILRAKQWHSKYCPQSMPSMFVPPLSILHYPCIDYSRHGHNATQMYHVYGKKDVITTESVWLPTTTAGLVWHQLQNWS